MYNGVDVSLLHSPSALGADMSIAIQQRNRELARRINDEVRRKPQSQYAGKFVGIVNGRVAAIADDLDELGRTLEAMSADPAKTFCIEAGRDYDAVHEIWSCIVL